MCRTKAVRSKVDIMTEHSEKWLECAHDFEPEIMQSQEFQPLMMDDEIESLLSAAADSRISSVYFKPNIPSKKLKNAISKKPYRTDNILKEEDIWILVDDTNMGSAKDGVLVTNIGIFWHEVGEDSGAIPWRIGNSRVTEFIYESGWMAGQLSAIIDDESRLNIWKNMVVSNDSMNQFVAILDVLANIANAQYGGLNTADSTVSSGGNSPPDLSGIDPELIEMIIAGKIFQCPSCQEFSLQKKSLTGRAAKGLLRGFAKYARWESAATGNRSIVGKRGGLFDSAVSDAAFACFNCGYYESDGEFLSRT